MYKIGVIGDRESVLCFLAVGFTVKTVESAGEAAAALKKMAADGEYAVIYLVEEFAMQLEDEIGKYKDSPLPAVIVIPGKKGSEGYGMENVRKSVQRAVGADILFK